MSAFMKNGFPFAPFKVWMKGYNKSFFKADLLAGLSLSLLMAPQSMANAVLVGLPAQHGLYAAAIPGFVGALFGASRELVTMPVAIISMLAAAALTPLISSGAIGYAAYVALLTLMVGIIQLCLGLLRMGILVNFLSSPVLEGFTNAAAVLIASSQLSKLLGIEVESGTRQLDNFLNVVNAAMSYVHWPTVSMACFTLLVLYLAKKYVKALPDVLIAVTLATIFSWAIDFEKHADVPITSIYSERAIALINSLEAIKAGTNDLDAQRKALTTRFKHLGNEKTEAYAELQYSYDLQIIELKKERFRYDAAIKRDILRTIHLVQASNPDDPTQVGFYEANDVPAGYNAGWRQWRIKANQPVFKATAIAINGGGAVVGAIPSGLPQFELPVFDTSIFLDLFSVALVIALIGFATAISIAKGMSMKRGYFVDPNQELIGQGMANIAGGFCLSPPCSGSFGVSAVNFAYGSRTPVAVMTASVCILAMIFFLTPLLYHMPLTALAVIITRSVFKLVNFESVRRAWAAKWYDGVISMITFAATLYFAPHLDYGILVGVALTVMMSFYRTMRPKVVRLSSGPDFLSRDAAYHNLPECEHIAVLYFQQDLIYSNAAVLEEHVLERMENMPKLKHMHFVCNGINDMDASGEETLAHLIHLLHKAGVTASVSGLTGAAADVLERTGVLAIIGPGNIFRGLHEAVCTVHGRIRSSGTRCPNCPWTGYCGAD